MTSGDTANFTSVEWEVYIPAVFLIVSVEPTDHTGSDTSTVYNVDPDHITSGENSWWHVLEHDSVG